MSSEATPISPARFASALKDLPLSTLHLKAAEYVYSSFFIPVLYSQDATRNETFETLHPLPSKLIPFLMN
jgi:hypothetical protein